ncbi:MAG: discoidin domain-containing protein [Verrucomicrobiota bacterium]
MRLQPFRRLTLIALGLYACSLCPGAESQEFPPQPPVQPLSAEAAAKTFQLPPGYKLELVLSEPDVMEPVCMAFDGNGRLYVAEMLTYMRDIEGTDELVPKSRVSVHWSSKNDGVFDQHRVYADNLLLPRILLPMDEGVLIGETDTNDLYLYHDTNGDGVSDERKRVYEGGPRGGNMEHQPSGLTWANDNWLYSAVNNYRLRWKDGQLIKQDIPGNGGQWGGTQDDQGKFWVVNAGGEKGPLNFQQHILYGQFMTRNQFEPGFEVVWPAVGLRDYQGGPGKSREDNTLNHFTATCGGEIYRGDRLPAELKGNLFFGEPVGRLVRRTQIEVKDGITILHNPHPQNEFLRSTDVCFRPVDMKTAPDGTLFICDMYRGVIQEGNWTREGSYLRKVLLQHSFDKVTGRGRVWRLVHDSMKPTPAPQLLTATPAELVEVLGHPNGWQRDTAQKLLVLKQDRSVLPALEAMLKGHANALARMHALWTLEGLNALTAELVRGGFKDADASVRHAAIRASESLMVAGDAALQADVMALAGDADPAVAIQVLLTAKLLKWKDHAKFINASALVHPSKGVKEMAAQILTNGSDFPKEFSASQKDFLSKGQVIYQELCFTCHGLDGRGTLIGAPGAEIALAPPLSGSKVVLGHRDGLIRAVLHGVTGPVNGKTYQGQMIPMANNDDAWVATVTSYIRNRFGNSASLIDPDDVARVRAETQGRTAPWTEKELATAGPTKLTNRSTWKLDASHKATDTKALTDGELKTRWDSGTPMTNKMWLTVELPAETEVCGVRVDGQRSGGHFGRGLRVEVSADGKKWSKPVYNNPNAASIAELLFKPVTTKFLRISQTSGGDNRTTWSLEELDIYAATPNQQ